ncbi:hypothetical protein J4455_00440 [Candidatus Woesearchaeota archaeon]|nr:hypothetical protein [Candidatus Woesearchaeota archaeon]
MQKTLLILFLISILIVAGCQLQQEIPPDNAQEKTEPTPESIAQDLQTTDDIEDIDNIEVLIDENTF